MSDNLTNENDDRKKYEEDIKNGGTIERNVGKTVPWTPRDVMVAMFWFLVIITIGAILIKRALGAFMPEGANTITLLTGYLVSLLLLKHYTIGKGAEWSDLGVKSFDFLFGTVLVVFAFITTKILIAVYAVLARYVGIEQSLDIFEKIPNLFGRSIWGFLMAVFVVAVVAPIIEELFFRGFVYASFKQTWGVSIAAVISSLLFALFHRDLYTYIPIAIIGMALVYLYEKTGSLWPSVMLHSLNNLVSIVVLYYYRVPLN